MEQFYRTNRPGTDDVGTKKNYSYKTVRKYVGNMQRTVPRIPYSKMKASKRAPGPATYSSMPNTFGKQFRVGNGRSAARISFGKSQRFKESHSSTFVGILKQMEKASITSKSCSPYLQNARPSTGKRRKRRKGKKQGSNKMVTPQRRPQSAPLVGSASSILPPGPMCYVHTDGGIGKQTSSARRNSPSVSFSKAKRDINLTTLGAGKGDSSNDTPGPNDYRTSYCRQRLSAHRPNCNFGTSPRFNYEK